MEALRWQHGATCRQVLGWQHWRDRWKAPNSGGRHRAPIRLGLAAIVLFTLGALLLFFQESRRVSQFRHPTLVYDQEGNPWFDLHDPLGTHLKLSEMPPHLAQAVIAVEDRRFYNHGSVDFRGIARALWQNLRSGGIRQGGSTLTQQLARQVFLTHHRTFSRKLREAVLASQLESELSKDEILEAYLNRVFMGGSLYGMPAAARYFFGKEVTQISVAEAATLAAIIRAPNFYSPKANPERLVDRRDLVLKRMLDERYLTPQQYQRSLREKLKFVRMRAVDRTETYFKEFVRSELVDLLGDEVLDEYGYSVYTSYSPHLQSLAESAANQEIARLEASGRLYRYPDHPELQVGLVSIEVQTGRINAMVAGRNYGGSQYNHVTQALRQPGSAFKPILYAAALSRGFTPASTITLPPEGPDSVEEFTEAEAEQPMTTLRDALTKSVNSAAVALISKVGKTQTVEMAQRLGIRSPLPEVQSLALGAGEVRLLELTAAFMAFPSGGNVFPPHSIIRVEDGQKKTLYEEKLAPAQAISEEVAYQMTSMLSDVVIRGTAAGYATAGMPFPIGGKTGTTNDYKDAWFVGFSPKIVCGVWVGYDTPRPIMPAGYGARLALPIWGRYMRGTDKLIEHERFSIPRLLRPFTLCRISGGLATEGCNYAMRSDGTTYSAAYTEYLIPGTEPADPCPLHAAAPGQLNRIWEGLRRILPKIAAPFQ
ncbi:MAG: PBP1A family penicillin-binding protein [Acidobacteria bacterium]|nr:PBP1A family penicillin-binding protein [Acidobacteriota bacterium]